MGLPGVQHPHLEQPHLMSSYYAMQLNNAHNIPIPLNTVNTSFSTQPSSSMQPSSHIPHGIQASSQPFNAQPPHPTLSGMTYHQHYHQQQQHLMHDLGLGQQSMAAVEDVAAAASAGAAAGAAAAPAAATTTTAATNHPGIDSGGYRTKPYKTYMTSLGKQTYTRTLSSKLLFWKTHFFLLAFFFFWFTVFKQSRLPQQQQHSFVFLSF